MLNHSTVHQKVNAYVKKYMQENGVRQSFLAEKMNYTPKKFSELLNGRALMRIEDLEKICEYFGVPASLFIQISTDQKGA